MTPARIAQLLEPYLAPTRGEDTQNLPANWLQIYQQLVSYLELILKWNERINLTSIREPEEIVRRHFGESLFAGLHLSPCSSLLDFGSGAGFPGLPIQLLRPDLPITLAESRTRKAAFLREAVRTLGLPTEVWAERVEAMPSARRFDTVALRAVDNMEAAICEAAIRAARRLCILTTGGSSLQVAKFELAERIPLPGSDDGVLALLHRR